MIKTIEAQVKSLIADQCQRVQEMLAGDYEEQIGIAKANLSQVSRKVYDTPKIVDLILAAARERNLDVGCTYCVTHEGDCCLLRTNICICMYPDFPDKKKAST